MTELGNVEIGMLRTAVSADALHAMVAERALASGAPAPAARKPFGYAAFINNLRYVVEYMANENHALDTGVHVNGDIEGVAAITYWTLPTLLTAAEVGGGSPRTWTNIPERITGAGNGVYASRLTDNYAWCYAEHFNEIAAAARLLTHFWTPSTWVDGAWRTGYGESSDEDEETRRSEAIAAASANWDANSWVAETAYPLRLEVTESDIGTAVVELLNWRGKAHFEWAIPAGTAKIFCRVYADHLDKLGGNESPPVAGDGLYHLYALAGCESPYTSAMLAGSKATPVDEWLNDEIFWEASHGDDNSDLCAIVAPTFTVI